MFIIMFGFDLHKNWKSSYIFYSLKAKFIINLIQNGIPVDQFKTLLLIVGFLFKLSETIYC